MCEVAYIVWRLKYYLYVIRFVLKRYWLLNLKFLKQSNILKTCLRQRGIRKVKQTQADKRYTYTNCARNWARLHKNCFLHKHIQALDLHHFKILRTQWGESMIVYIYKFEINENTLFQIYSNWVSYFSKSWIKLWSLLVIIRVYIQNFFWRIAIGTFLKGHFEMPQIFESICVSYLSTWSKKIFRVKLVNI